MNEIAWAMLAAVLVIVPLLSFLLTKRYADPDDSDKLTTGTTTLGLTLSLLTLFLVPVDIYLVSANVDEFGFQKDLDATNSALSAMKTLYYIIYATLLAMAFAVMPFVYFYFEEEEEDSTVRSRALGALKYTTLFVIVFAVLIGLGVVLKSGQFKNADQGNYVDNLKNSFGAGESILTFCISCLALLGLFGWIAYAAYGLAAFPISLMRTFDTVERPSGGYSRESQEDIELKLRKTEAELKFLTSRYQLGTEQMTPSDKKQLQHLKREQTRLQSIINRRAGNGAAAKAGAVKDWFQTIWNATAPLRIIVGLVLLGLSLLIVVSYMLSAIDRAVHSDCKWSCAFTVEKSSLPNPVDLALKKFSTAFPVDYVAFGGIVLYIFLCSVGAMVTIGIRLLCWQLYTVEKKKTMPHGLIMGAWLLMFMVLLMNMEVMTLAPRYTTFGNQFYMTATNNTLTKEECSTAIYASSNHTLCVPTQVSRFIQSTDLAMPFFGVIFYMANYLFFFAFFLSLVASIFYRPKPTSYEKMKDDSLLRDEF